MRRLLLFCLLMTFLARPAAAEVPAALVTAIQARDGAAVEALLAQDPRLVRQATLQGQTPLILAAFGRERGGGFVRPEDNAAFAVLARRVIDPNPFEAVLLHDLKRVRAALARDPGLVKAAAANGWTLLHFAAYAGADDIADLLIAKGARLDARAMGAFGVTPVQSALLVRRNALADHLLAVGADPWVRFSEGSSLLHEAGLLGDVEMVEMLGRRGANPMARRDDGKTPRDIATARNHPEAAGKLEALEAAWKAAH
ncbi:MAG: ankyrin repeat domain-containing protein [Phenylobacterium sp.]